MPFCRNGDVRIHYRVEGVGPTVVLHTGAGGDHRIWSDAGYVQGLPGFRLVLLDPRGRGRSTHPSKVPDHEMDRYVDDVAAVLDDIGAESAGFWGYSNGTLVGLAFGARFPNRLRALVGTGNVPAYDLSTLPPILDRAKFIAEVVATGGVQADVDRYTEAENDRFPEVIDRNVRATDPVMGALRRIAWRSWVGPATLYPAFRCPVLIIAGEKEDRESENAKAVALLPDGRLEVLPGQGHLSAFYRSELALALARPFLERHVPAAPGPADVRMPRH